MKKLATLIATLAIAGSAFACWYKKINYVDYIYGVNDQKDIVTYEITK